MLDAIQALFGSCCVVLEENSGKDKDIRKESAQMWTKRAVRRGVVPSKPDTKATTPSAVFDVQRPEKASEPPEVVDVDQMEKVNDRTQQDLENCLQELANAIRSEDFERAKQLKTKRDKLCSAKEFNEKNEEEEEQISHMTKEERISKMIGRFTSTPELQKAQMKYHNRAKQLAQCEKRVEKDSKDFEDGFTVNTSY
jgi:hypothetical protein